ncbi:MAG: 3-hydroxybenzoate 4-monooxygenase [Hydrogenophaga sp.]|uniref:FAD-binding monooxygenase n=1 Tax=Hydrogenophaga sp. TaxID=1904254 RepID=UPI0016B04CBD|nr:FAD-binding monooxygenase [Hydrogenophaga sp.]NIM42974.1 3-hydroxybenzoate 4-monooxygenase [Hydrogenophaga sp.]NIN27904.1 3-hydroxybenzoate 4-monooxygenase [Hydrogenophaga sp.]NIN29585.1 3-hydroxybenzoate 4-monooxygenase [Hydrogenophaga sp.]NIN57177.1 3-hydroxybenzoate 4-monooxygenase [Hydrogenophaga sp.]NIO53588.1 3-hydroxybenzoate 4-monooxygenase [Hydrogenophaga sp.]
MQFYLNGYRPGDPDLLAAAPGATDRSWGPDETVDVLVVGSGPAGVVLAAQLAQFPGIRTRLVERRQGPLELGQADGVACRTVEMFEAFGLGAKLRREGYWVNETAFWRPAPGERSRIVRTGRVQDVEDGLSEMPHLIVNQARMQAYLLDFMRQSPTRLEPDYGLEFVDLTVDADGEHPVRVTLREVDGGATRTLRARYVVGCDGARSRVRQAIGAEPRGDFANHAWGVVDMLAVTDFPDIRLKAAIQSADEGNILLIPREGGYLVRLYVDLGEVDPAQRSDLRERYTADKIVEVAQRVLRPYTLEVRDVAWSSVYEVGQRVTDRFDDVPQAQAGARLPRVFIAGDACHTHSPKAGQGMNVSMQDAFNLGWKLVSVLEGRAGPELLRTYGIERHAIAQGLIDFDKEWSKIMASPPKDPKHPELGGVDPAELQAYFVKSGRYTAGVATHYPSETVLTAPPVHQHLATGFTIGMRFHSAPVIRLADAKPMHLGHAARADAAWRLYAFADASGDRLRALAHFLDQSADSPMRRFTPAGADIDSVIDLRAIFQQGHRELEVDKLPPLLLPRKGRFGLIDYEKVFCPDLKNGPDIFTLRGIDRGRGALVVVRPDQYVANVLPLEAHEELSAFFGRFLKTPKA